MLYLILTILMSLLIAVILKINETRKGERLVVAGANYVVASLLGVGFTGVAEMHITSVWITVGVLIGGGFVAGFMVMMRTIRDHGIAVPASIARLSMLVPVTGSVLLFGEQLDGLRITGILLGIAAFILLGISRHSATLNQPAHSRPYMLLVLLFLVIGLNDFGMKTVQQQGVNTASFLLVVFSSAALICWSIVMTRRLPVRRHDLLLGGILGIPNYLSTYFLILSLHSLPAGVVFPIVSAGGVVAATTAGIIAWREIPNRTSMIGIILAAIAVAILGFGT